MNLYRMKTKKNAFFQGTENNLEILANYHSGELTEESFWDVRKKPGGDGLFNKQHFYFFLDMHAKMLAGLLLTILLSISFLRSESQAMVVPGLDRMQRGVGLVRRDWPMQLSQDQKHLISQFLPHLYACKISYPFPLSWKFLIVGWGIPTKDA